MNIKIEKLDHFGRGIAHINGKICFVEQALPEEVVELKITKETKKYYLGKITKYLKKSPNRVIPQCPYYNTCGGCNLAHLDYSSENIYKQEKVKELLKHLANADINVMNIEYQQPSNYRNKVTLHGDNHKLGYYKKETNELVEIAFCNLLDNKINKLIPVLQKLAKTNQIKEAVIRVDNDSKKIILSLTGKINNISIIKNIDVLMLNDSIISKDNQIITQIGDQKYYLSANSFFQVNKFLTKRLYDEVKNIVKKEHPKTLLDLYCGTGTIGIYVSKYAGKIIGIDCLESNIIDASKNKELNNITNIDFIHAKVENIIENFSSNIDLIIVDPPRAGLDSKTISNLKRINAKTIIYVSCDPATLARDLKELSVRYKIKYIKPFNMFPRTYHVECVSVLHQKALEK